MAVAKDQDPTLLMKVVVMLAPYSVPLTGTGGGPRVPLGIGISSTGSLRLIPDRVHQAESLLNDHRPGGVVQLAQAFVDDQLAEQDGRRADGGGRVARFFRRQRRGADINRRGVGRSFGANVGPVRFQR